MDESSSKPAKDGADTRQNESFDPEPAMDMLAPPHPADAGQDTADVIQEQFTKQEETPAVEESKTLNVDPYASRNLESEPSLQEHSAEEEENPPAEESEALSFDPNAPSNFGTEEVVLGCLQEAKRADKVAGTLVRLRSETGPESYDQITAIIKEVENSSRLLRDLHDLFPFYRARISVIVYYLHVLLPSFCKSLRDMMVYLDNYNLTPQSQWAVMHEELTDQGEIGLAARFVSYTEFLIQMVRLLSKSPLYDPTTLELLRMRILRLRALQNIPAPPISAHQAAGVSPPNSEIEGRRHWAEKVFYDQPNQASSLRHLREQLLTLFVSSRCFGPPMIEARLGITPGSMVLFKLPFDKNHLSITFFLQPEDPGLTRVLCRWMDQYYNPLYCCYSTHELLCQRKGSSLRFHHWSVMLNKSLLWLALFFKTYEKMVLFHCSFTAAKFRNPLTFKLAAEECQFGGETRLFQGKIIDDGFEHLLSVVQDHRCHAIRLLASVSNGELRRCPVWTAFITQQSTSPDWLERRSRHRIWLKDIEPYVFCKNYKPKHATKKNGEFEIYFVNEKAADAFQDLFVEESQSDSVGDIPETQSQSSNIVKDDEGGQNSEDSSSLDYSSDVSNSRDSRSENSFQDSLENFRSGDTNPNPFLQWQGSVNQGVVAQEDFSWIIFDDCLKVLAALSNTIRERPHLLEKTSSENLREEFRKFLVWNDMFSKPSRQLGPILATSRNLNVAVLSLMARWSRALCKVPRMFPESNWKGAIPSNWVSVIPEIAKLEVTSSKVEQVVAALSRDNILIHEDALQLQANLIPDDISESSSIETVTTIDDIIEEMKVCTECLVDLLPSLENPAKDIGIFEEVRSPEVISEGSQPWWPFFLGVKDKFPLAEKDLVVCIGESIWRRWEKIRLSHATKAEALGRGPAVYKPGDIPDVRSEYSESAISLGQSTRSSKSTFSTPSIFDKPTSKTPKLREDPGPEEYINPEARLRRRESFSSVRSSIATNATKSGQRRVPIIPNEARNGGQFECFVCQEKIRDIQNRDVWKKHIFNDLEPYICTFGKCSEALRTFNSRREWSKHESTTHETQFQKRLESGDCPLCLKPIIPVKHLSRHMGRHLRELSLASLPPLDITGDDEKAGLGGFPEDPTPHDLKAGGLEKGDVKGKGRQVISDPEDGDDTDYMEEDLMDD